MEGVFFVILKEGSFMPSFGCTSILRAELGALLKGIRLATAWDIKELVVETDCKEAMEYIHRKK